MEFLIVIGFIIGFLWLCGAFDGNSSSSSSKPKSSHSSYYHSSPSHYSSHRTTYQNTDHERAEFNQLKTTDTFKKWKKAQYNCQDGKCAWCGCQLDLHSPYTQVDHLKPLCKGGSPTDFDNLVLACKSCNYWCKKGNYTWRDKNGTVHNGWNKPSWIKDNPIKNTTTQKDTEDTDPIYDLSDIPF